MKKRIVAMLVAAVLCMGVTGALAAYGRGYVDADGDGVCDHRTSCGYVDTDGDGVCDRCAAHGYVDADGDGLCDRCGLQACVDADGDCRHCADGCQMGGTRPRDGSGMHRGHGGRHGGR